MKAVWVLLVERYPWLLIIPCAGHFFYLLFGDICKHHDVARVLTFLNTIVQFWLMRGLPKAILECCPRA